jgi:hypothetical protein
VPVNPCLARTLETHEVFNLVPVRALPDADFASFPTILNVLPPISSKPFPTARVIPRTSGTAS